ncbi:serine hydrolase [Terracidiphilus gabretensis]|uniref:serine hydrolase n=1 Tax=Terracidiphilus gabretensis TaxID=1577687 RepID=UPI0009E81F79|nr:serine hydrolase [Terracidiphilus gabretensis]
MMWMLGAGVCVGYAGMAVAQGTPEVQKRIAAIENCVPPTVLIRNGPEPCPTLAKRMAELHVPGVSIAVVHKGAIEWAKGYGVRQTGGEPVNADTVFQAGSISKPVAALAALHLVEQGKLSLDADINTELTSWKLPPSDAAPGATVTLRELLTHTAGMTVHGFPGYEAGVQVPTLVQVLNGEKPANTDAIRVDSAPGKNWRYSGGGFTVMQQMAVDAAKEPFPKLLHDTVLAPIGMSRSTYEQPLPADRLKNAAMPYNDDGTPVKGGPHTYPEMAAAGLWTTPSDLCRYILEVQNSLAGKTNHVLSQSMTEKMLTGGMGGWGLGVQLGGAAGNPWFSHGGVNAGYESLFVAYDKDGDGAVVMTNAQGGTRLADEVMHAIAAVYDWPDYRPVERTIVKVDPTVLAKYVGTYELSPDFSIVFTLEGNQLMTQATHQPKFPVYPESETKFFLTVVDAEVEFVKDDKGQISYAILHQGGQDHKAVRK